MGKAIIRGVKAYTQELAEIIATRISRGELLDAICEDPDMPAAITVYGWIRRYPDFAELYAAAKWALGHALVRQAMDIADDGSQDFLTKKNPANGKEFESFDSEHVQRSKLRVQYRQWAAAKVDPANWGDKVEVEHTGNSTQVLQVFAIPDNGRDHPNLVDNSHHHPQIASRPRSVNNPNSTDNGQSTTQIPDAEFVVVDKEDQATNLGERIANPNTNLDGE